MEQDNINPDIPDISDVSSFANKTDESIIKVIGVGGGGCNAVNYMYQQNIPYVNFVVCNTDIQHLERITNVPNKLVLGESIVHGLGAGNDPVVGRKCAESSEEQIRELFKDNTEMVFITAGMGGGTGTGAAPVVARIAKEMGILTIGIVTVPFLFEGDKKILKALEGADEMARHVDALLMINNQNLIELYKDFSFFTAFGKADETLANAARSISEIISEPCYINVDFQDVKTTLRDSGTAIISTAYGEGENRISKAIHEALHSPLLKKHDIFTSKRLLLKFMASKDAENPLRAEEIAEIYNFTAKLPPSIDVKWGIGDNPELGDKVKITVLASGFDVTIKTGKEGNGEKEEKKIVMRPQDENPSAPTVDTAKKAALSNMAEVYGHDKIKKHTRDAVKLKYAVLTPDQFDDYDVIALLEREPAYNRAPDFNERLRKLKEPAPAKRPENSHEFEKGATITFGEGDF